VSTTRLLIRGGHVLTMDAQRRVLNGADVLIEGDRIAEIGFALVAAGAEVIDAQNAIVMPGLVDCHRHLWQTNLRALLADWTLHEYMRGIRFNISPVLRPQDIGSANYIGALEAINAGVTTVFDYSHSNNTPEHADAGVEGLKRSGIRAVYGYGFVPAPLAEPVFKTVAERIADAERVHIEQLASRDALVVMGAALTEMGLIPLSDNRREIAAARDMGVVQSLHNNLYWGSSIGQGVGLMHRAGLLGPDQLHVHCNTCSADEFGYLADAGCTIVCTPDTEMQMGMGHPAFLEAARHGILCTSGCDIITLNGGDLIGQLRLGLQDARVRANDAFNKRGEMPLRLGTSSMDALAWGTINGAKALGLDSRIGSLEPGKQADILIISGAEPNLWPLNPEPGTVVFHSHPYDIETVLIAGRPVKRRHRLVGVDYAKAQAEAAASRDWILDTVLREKGTLLPPEESLSLISLEETAQRNMRS
jgi:5-methylthioadenosine/S-adenosylhomocysteine deaminase